MDLFLGNYTVNPSEGVSVPSPFEARKRGTLMRLVSLLEGDRRDHLSFSATKLKLPPFFLRIHHLLSFR